MSSSERRRQFKGVSALCAECRARKALFKYRGQVRADRDHTLCFECYRAEVNRARARRLNELPAERQLASLVGHHEGADGWFSSEEQTDLLCQIETHHFVPLSPQWLNEASVARTSRLDELAANRHGERDVF